MTNVPSETAEYIKLHARQLRAVARLLKARARRVDQEALTLERFAGDTAADRRRARDQFIASSKEAGAELARRFRLSKGRVSQIRATAAPRDDHQPSPGPQGSTALPIAG